MSDYLSKIKNLIAEKTGAELAEIQVDSFIEDDLNIGEMELIEILEELEDKYEVELLDMKDDFETVGDILDALTENLD